MTSRPFLPRKQCPKCGKNANEFYGGERGEAGPFLYCGHCDYDSEQEQQAQQAERKRKVDFPDDLGALGLNFAADVLDDEMKRIAPAAIHFGTSLKIVSKWLRECATKFPEAK